jgi:hypothetical protein
MCVATERKLVPAGMPESPPFADVGYVHKRGEIVTLLLMRRQFGPEDDRDDGTPLRAPVIASVTMTVEVARGIAELLAGVTAEPRKL